ncbi:MAG TPA: efflux RND transporter periplasmic adaptor subunit [Chthoniobacter sp.]|jgi:multidrug efflux system membrane fusion protein
MLRLLIWIGLLAIFGFAFYLVLTAKPAPKKGGGRRGVTGPITINTATAQKGDIGSYLDSIGTVTPVYTASMFAQITGAVTDVHFTEGQEVNKGDPLVDIDSRQYEASLLQAQGALERDQNLLAQAQMDLKRYQEAWARNAVSKQILDDQEKLMHQDQGTVKNDQGAVKFAQVQVDYCHITAPITGVVGLRLIDPGNLVTAGSNSNSSPLAVITQIHPITVVFTIAEDHLGAVLAQLRKKSKLSVDVYDRADQTKLATGELTALDNQIDTTTGTVRVRSTFANEDSSLYPNQFVNTRLLVETLKDATLVPTSAIQQNGQTSFVYVIQDDVAHLRDIKPGIADDRLGMTQVEGVEPGEVLADSSFDKLQDGDKIILASAKPAAGHAHGEHAGKSADGQHQGHGGHGGNGPQGQ